jgi:hypothetical protein
METGSVAYLESQNDIMESIRSGAKSRRPANLAEDPFYVLQTAIAYAMDSQNPPIKGKIDNRFKLKLYYN